jgi:cell division protein FtsB
MSEILSWAAGIIAVTGVVTLFMASFKGNLSQDTIKLLQDNRGAQDAAIKRLEEADKEKTEQISNLNGQIQTLKDVPLAQIAKSMEMVSATHIELQQFLKQHQIQAQVLADGIADKVIQFLKDNHNV